MTNDSTDNSNLDETFAELASIRQQLIELPADAYKERSQLEQRRYELQRSLPPTDWDTERSTDDLLAELAAQRQRLHDAEQGRMNVAAQQGGGGQSGGGGDGWGAMQINLSVDTARDVAKIQTRIGRLKAILADRGVTYDDQ